MWHCRRSKGTWSNTHYYCIKCVKHYIVRLSHVSYCNEVRNCSVLYSTSTGRYIMPYLTVAALQPRLGTRDVANNLESSLLSLHPSIHLSEIGRGGKRSVRVRKREKWSGAGDIARPLGADTRHVTKETIRNHKEA
jgi:hypothetical protein